MTSQKSSKLLNNTPYAFRSALSSGFLPALFYGIFMLVAFPVLNICSLLDEKRGFTFLSSVSNKDIMTEEPVYKSLSEKYVYSLFDSEEMLMIFVLIATIGISIFMGISMFRFITAKKTVNVFYSLGIKRTNLFISRYFAGLALLFACIFVPVLLSALGSIILIGFNTKLLIAAFFTVLSIFSTAALTYSLTAAIFSAVGTSIEGIIFTAVMLLVPTAVFYCLEAFGANLLYGTPLKAGYIELSSGYYQTVDLIYEYGMYNPIIYLAKLFDTEITYGYLTVSVLENLEQSKVSFTEQMNFAVPAVWLIISCILTVVGIAVFNRRRSEICGFIGMSSVLNFLTSFIISFGVFTIIVNSMPDDRFTLALIIGFITMAVIYFIFNLIITRAPKRVFKTSYLLAVQMLIVGIVLGVFATGGFGYSSKIPDEEDIQDVYVSPVAIDTMLFDNFVNTYYFSPDEDEPVYRHSMSNFAAGPYTSKNDISRALRLHRKLIGLGAANLNGDKCFNSQIVIHYTLKNGKTFTRYFTKADLEALRMCLEFYDSDLYNTLIDNAFGSNLTLADGKQEMNIDYYTSVKVITASSSLKAEDFSYMDLSQEQFSQLKASIAADFKSLTAQQLYSPDTPAIGAIIFAPYERLLQNQTDIFPEYMLCREVFGIDKYTAAKTVFITADMVQTLAFLEQNSLMQQFASVGNDEVESISFRPAVINRDEWPYSSGTAITLSFFAQNRTVDNEYYGYYYEDEAPVSEKTKQNTITDKIKIAEILSKAQLYYYTENKGYVCYITYQSGETVEKYLPSADAPDYVTNYSYR